MTLSVRLPGATAKALDQVCRATARPRNYFIVKALDRNLSQQADDQVALGRLLDKDDPLLSSADMKKQLARHPRHSV